MLKRVITAFTVLINLVFLPYFSSSSLADWSYVELEDVSNDLWAIWGSSAADVYAVGTLGINLHYDGNPKGDWTTLPDISP